MSDLSGPLKRAIAQALRADAGVIAAFGANPVRVYDVPPDNTPEPYLTLGPGDVLPVEAEGFDLSEIDYPVHAWSLTSPPGTDEAEAISVAVRARLRAPLAVSDGRVYVARPIRSVVLIDPSDDRTAHAVVTFRFTTAAA